MNHILHAVRLGSLAAASWLAVEILGQESVHSRYWQMLNEGWDWNAPAASHEGRVFIASSDSDAVRRCLDRRSGKELWVARAARTGFAHSPKAASVIGFLGGNEAVVIAYGSGGDAPQLL